MRGDDVPELTLQEMLRAAAQRCEEADPAMLHAAADRLDEVERERAGHEQEVRDLVEGAQRQRGMLVDAVRDRDKPTYPI